MERQVHFNLLEVGTLSVACRFEGFHIFIVIELTTNLFSLFALKFQVVLAQKVYGTVTLLIPVQGIQEKAPLINDAFSFFNQ